MFETLKKRLSRKGADRAIYFSIFVLAIFGIVMIGSSSVGSVSQHGVSYAIKNMVMQSIYVGVGIFAMIVMTKTFTSKWVNYSNVLVLYFSGLIAMAICRLFTSVNGSYAWIRLFGFTIQPAEFMKLFLVLLLAYYLTEIDKALTPKAKFKSKEKRENFFKYKIKHALVIPGIFLAVAFLVGAFVQKDFGTSVILLMMGFICFMATPRTYYRKYKKLAWALVAVAGAFLVIFFTGIFKSYQIDRIASWLQPLKDYTGSSYQLVNSLIAFSNGGLFGVGLGNSTQKFSYIPEAQNDFIGAVIYEELGIIGLALIIIPTCIIIFKLLSYAEKVKDDKEKIILIGVASYFLLHLFVNLGGISGLIPMTGVPLLLISSGGSSAVVSFLGIGICQAIIAKYNRGKMINGTTD